MPNDSNYDTGEDAEEKPDSDESEDSSDKNTALLSKSFFRNKDSLKPGAIEKIKILELMDDEALVECVYEKDSKDKDSDDDRGGPMRDAESEMDGMVSA